MTMKSKKFKFQTLDFLHSSSRIIDNLSSSNKEKDRAKQELSDLLFENMADLQELERRNLLLKAKNNGFPYLILLGIVFIVLGIVLVVTSIKTLANISIVILISTMVFELIGAFLIVAHLHIKRLADKDRQTLLIDESRAQIAIDILNNIADRSRKDEILARIAETFLRPDLQSIVKTNEQVPTDNRVSHSESLKIAQLDEYLVAGGLERMKFDSERCSDVKDFQEFLLWFELAYNIIYLIEYDPEILFEFGNSIYRHKEDAYYFQERIIKHIPQADRLFLNRVSMSSPGFWEFIGKWNIFEQLRLYLNERHERQKDRDYRNEHEKRRGELRIEYIERQHKILRSKSQIAIDSERELKEESIERERLTNMLLENQVIRERIETLKQAGRDFDDYEIEKLQLLLIEPLTHLRIMRNKRLLGDMNKSNPSRKAR